MDAAHPTPLCGPVPEGLFRLTVDMPEELFDELQQACLRRGIPLDRLVTAALRFASAAA